MRPTIKLPSPKLFWESMLNAHQAPGKTGIQLLTFKDFHLLVDNRDRIPTLTFIFLNKDDSYTFYPDSNTLRWASKIMAALEKEDWDTDDIRWKIDMGLNLHGFPDDWEEDIEQQKWLRDYFENLEKEIEDIWDTPYLWVQIKLMDRLS